MFDHFSPGENIEKRKVKCILLMQNGNPGKLFRLQFHKGITREQLIKAAQKNWGPSNGYRMMRIFSVDAVEYFEEDLLYIKNGDRLYLSRGEEFDSNSNFGQFEMIKKLGQGGFGSVELARNIVTGELAAIKILKTDKNSTFADIDMIFKEAENLKSLNHPNIVKILNCYAMSNMRVVIVMQYLEGGELLNLLKEKGRFDEATARSFFKQIIHAVWYCHRQGIIHRDLKLQNILMKDKKTVKVADFGISGVADRFNPQADWGTLKYMAPQILSGKDKSNSPSVDVWACGVILYLMVTGVLPYSGSSTAEIMDNIINKPLEFPSDILLTLKCKNLIKKMLQKKPSERVSMPDVENDPWVVNREERISNILKTTASEDFNLRTNEIKKQQRKSVNIPKPMNVKVPKRLEKERDRLLEQLRQYKLYKKSPINSEKKLFPSLRRKQKYSDISKLGKPPSAWKQERKVDEKKGNEPILRK